MCVTHKPHAIVVAATDMRAVQLKQGIERTLKGAADSGRLDHDIPVEYVTGEAAKIYAKSKMSEVKFEKLN